MRIKLLSVAVGLAAMLVGVSSAGAITYGEPDGSTHANVGALIAEWRTPGVKEHVCSGTLISPTVFLTAAHCTAYLESLGIPSNQIWVTFDQDADPVTETTKLYKGTWHTHPGYPGTSSDPADVAVVVFDKAVKGIEPAKLPTAGLFDELAKKNGLKGQKFTAVGYGVHEPQTGGGGATWPYDGERWRSVSEFNALNAAWLRLSQVGPAGDGGTCYGDSGGPNFLGTGSETVPGMVASITVTGDYMCLATNDTYRMDIATVRNFLDDFVALP